MATSLDGRTAFVTGAGSGFGCAIARQFAQAGARVFGADIDSDGLAQTKAQVEADGFDFAAVEHDVRDEASWRAGLDAAFKDGRCDILVNNAGIATIKSFSSMTLDDFQGVNAVNLIGNFIGTKLFVEKLRASYDGAPAHGAVINISSVTAKRPMPGFCAYAPSKAAVSNLTRALAAELGLKGDFIRVNAVAPGLARTNMTKDWIHTEDDGSDDPTVEGVPIKRFAETAEVAKAALYLASDRAKFVTGYVLPVDGGLGDI